MATNLSLNVSRGNGDDTEAKIIQIRDDATATDVDAAYKRAHDWLDEQRKKQRG
jgi:hypothetical protein